MTDNHPGLAGRALCDLTDVMRYVPGYEPQRDVDATLLKLIDSVSVDAYRTTGREFVARTTQPEARTIEIGQWETEQRKAVIGDLSTVDGATVVEILLGDGTLDQTVAAGAYHALPRSWDRDAWEPVTEIAFPRLVQAPANPARLGCGKQLQITGRWGFPEIPPNVVESIAKLVIVRYVTDVSSQATAFTDALGDINIAGMFRSANEALEDWRWTSIG